VRHYPARTQRAGAPPLLDTLARPESRPRASRS
jgi:hypothetical protein